MTGRANLDAPGGAALQQSRSDRAQRHPTDLCTSLGARRRLANGLLSMGLKPVTAWGSGR